MQQGLGERSLKGQLLKIAGAGETTAPAKELGRPCGGIVIAGQDLGTDRDRDASKASTFSGNPLKTFKVGGGV